MCPPLLWLWWRLALVNGTYGRSVPGSVSPSNAGSFPSGHWSWWRCPGKPFSLLFGTTACSETLAKFFLLPILFLPLPLTSFIAALSSVRHLWTALFVFTSEQCWRIADVIVFSIKIGIFSNQEIFNFCSVEVIQIRCHFVCNWQQFIIVNKLYLFL